MSRSILFVVTFAVLLGGPVALAQTPAVGANAPDFTLATPAGRPIQMSQLAHGNTLILVILRGYPGYQCPYCQKQVHDFLEHSAAFATEKATVLLVYPGPPADLNLHAKEFLDRKIDLPPNVVLVTDPDYKVTNLYGLRWNAPHETAYPSTFVINKAGNIAFEKVSHSHGDRLSAQDALNHIADK